MGTEKDQYSEQETRQRFDAALRGARIAGHKAKVASAKRAKRKGVPRRKVDR
jgi:hypothetical protein